MPSTAGDGAQHLSTALPLQHWELGPALHSSCSPVHSQTLLSYLQKGTHTKLQPELLKLAQNSRIPTADSQLY
ncbi:hypothetical protein Nmel_002117, partial [Mimus melanotis]